MIYIVSSQKRLNTDEIQEGTVEQCLEYFKDKEEVSCDTETSGFCPYKNNLLSLQLGDYNNQFVIDCLTIDIKIFKELLESKIILFHNAKFDLRFLYHIGIYPKRVYDTFLAECILTTGFTERDLSLKGVGLKYCNVELDKSIRGVIHKEGLSDRVIIYSALDTKYLGTIKYKQVLEIDKWNLQEVLTLENEVVKVFALMEYKGVPFNPTKWLEVADITARNRIELENKMDELIFNLGSKNHNILTKYCNIYTQGNLFFDTRERKCSINWSSPTQKLKLLKELGFKVDSVGDKELQKLKSKHPIVPLLIEYSKQDKLASSFGADFIKFINPITNRIHPEFWQILSSGRISVSKPNINQIPAHGELATKIRAAFEAPEGYRIVGGDYSGMELRLLAEFSQDPLWLETFRNGGDLHSILCSKTFNIPIEDVKKPFPPKPEFKYRDVQKTIDFGLAYGMSEFKLADTMQISVEEAKKLIKQFFSVVPMVKQFLDGIGILGRTRGYIKTGRPFSRIRWFDLSKAGQKELGEIERASKNHPMQGSNGDITKQAMITLQQIIDDNNYPVQIIMQVYDEIQTLCREDFAEEWKIILERVMIESAQIVIKTIPVEVDCKINSCWAK